jgi:signal transduction histidine kinase
MASYEDNPSVPVVWSTRFLAPTVRDRRRSLRAQRVARQLLELSRLTSGRESAEIGDVDLVAFVAAVLRDYPSVVIAESLAQAPVRTDSRRLAAVLFAVLDNAIVHGADPVEVRINADSIVVVDHGCGFSQQLLSEATKPFSTGSRVAGRGVGLGLACAAAQTALLSGSLRLDNEPSAGARVTVALSANP